jgi:hypothetical protein
MVFKKTSKEINTYVSVIELKQWNIRRSESLVARSPVEVSCTVRAFLLNCSQDSRRSRSDGPHSSVGFVESRSFCEAYGSRYEYQGKSPSKAKLVQVLVRPN